MLIAQEVTFADVLAAVTDSGIAELLGFELSSSFSAHVLTFLKVNGPASRRDTGPSFNLCIPLDIGPEHAAQYCLQIFFF